MNIKNCRYCGSEIAAQAAVCPICKYNQQPWRNTITYLAGITGFITLLISGLAFVGSSAIDIYSKISWIDDVRVLSLDTRLIPNFSAVISNVGSGPAFVYEIFLYWRSDSSRLSINRAINVGEFLSLPGKAPQGVDYDVYVSSRSGVASREVIANAAPDSETTPNKHCFLTSFRVANDTDLERMNKFYAAGGRKLATDKASAEILFYSVHSNRLYHIDFPVVVSFLRLAADNCKAISFE
jgi:hypothetical protein